MSDPKWDRVDSLIRKTPGPIAAPVESPMTPVAPIQAQIDRIHQQKLGIIGEFKKNKINRVAALEQLKAMHNAQIEATRHALLRAVDVEKGRVDTVANGFLNRITEEYLNDMREMGMKNLETRMNTILQLNEKLREFLEKAQSQDLPQSVKDATIQNIMKKYQEFTDRIMGEEIRLT